MQENADMIPHRTNLVFSPYYDIPWSKLYDDDRSEVELKMRIADDEGFHYSSTEDCFVNKSSDHFQISTTIHPDHPHPATLILENGQWKPIATLKLGFAGWNGGREREIMQMKNGRGPWVSRPVELEQLPPGIVTRVTVPLLHFDVPTNSEARQHDFLLEIRLLAITNDGATHLIQSYQSDRILVRAPPAFIFKHYRENNWPMMLDTQYRIMSKFDMTAHISEGFEFSEDDDCYVNKRMNCFEVRTRIVNNNAHDTAWICTEKGPIKKVIGIQMEFVCVEEENHANEMIVLQNRDDNNGPAVYRPVELETLPPGQQTNVTVPRLHFSPLTLSEPEQNPINPNAFQKHFLLLVRLLAVDHDGISHPIQTLVSSRFIVK